MKFLVVGLIKGGQITRLKEEADKKGHQLEGCHTVDLVIESEGRIFKPSVNGKVLSQYDLIYLCAGIETKRRFEWYIASDYLQNFTKTKVVNQVVVDPEFKYYPSQTWFYLKQYEEKIRSPKTFTVYSSDTLDMIEKSLGYPMILKISETHQGKGVYLVKSEKEAKEVIEKNPGNTFLLREFIPNDGDIRIFTVGTKAIGAMKRTPSKGDFRSNISAGGSGAVFDLDKNPEVKKLAESVSKVTGIEIAGVDVIIDNQTGESFILEVNTGPQFAGLEQYTPVNAAREIIEYFEQKCK